MAITISVIICTHDRPQSLRQTVDSVLAQKYRAAEIIIVNDAADDIDPDITAAIKQAKIPFKYFHREAPSLPASRNCGMAAADGDILLMLDDDVVFDHEYTKLLAELYEADVDRKVAAIGGVMVDSTPLRFTQRAWNFLAAVFAENLWGPRGCASRYVRLSPQLRNRLIPARRLSGGTISIRREIAVSYRFEEAFGGYGLGEDTEFSFWLTRAEPIYIAPELVVMHNLAEGGRPDMIHRGRMYVANMLHIARSSSENDLGTRMLMTYHFFGMILISLTWAALSRRRRNLDYAIGMIAELLGRGISGARKILCGS